MSETPRTVSLEDLQAVMERMLQTQEQNFTRAMEAQWEQILGEVKTMLGKAAETSHSTEQTGKGKEPIILDDSTPSENLAMTEMERK